MNRGEWLAHNTSGPAHKSNWPQVPAKPKRRQVSFYAVDVDGETVLTCKLNTTAMETARYFLRPGENNVEVRYVVLREEDFIKEDEARKERLWQERLYKPSPVRIRRFR